MSCSAKRTRNTRSHSQKDQPTKRFKVDPEGLKEKRSTTTIVHLNDHCLEEVFIYLSQADLVNVCETNSRFSYASERAFKRNYGKLQTIVSTVKSNQINAGVLNSSIKLLKSFGHLITKLLIEFELDKVEDLLESIGNNCGVNMNELELCHFGVSAYKRTHYNIGLKKIDLFLSELHERFPNLHHLKFEDRHKLERCSYFKTVFRPIPNLKSLTVAGVLFSPNDIRRFFRSNRELECLKLIDRPNCQLEVTQDFINFADAALPLLKNLENSFVSIKGQSNNPKRFKNLKKLTIGNSTSHLFHQSQFSLAGQNIEEIEIFTYAVYILFAADDFLRFKKLKRLVFHSIEFEPLLVERTIQLLIFEVALQNIKNMNQFTEVVIQLYRKDEDGNTVALEDLELSNLIKSTFGAVQWSIDEHANRFVISKIQN